MNAIVDSKDHQKADLPAISAPRLPYHPAIEERFGINLTEWRALVDAVFPLAKETSSVILALSYCRARKLDPFKKPVHIVPMYNAALKRMVETVWPGIGELRTTAFRTGQYAGRDEAKYGPSKTEKVGNTVIEYPEWCQVTVYRLLGGQRLPFPGPRVYWRENYATSGREDLTPNTMWRRRPFGQLDKCAEAASLRAAFPEEVGNEYAAEEMEGKIIEGTVADPQAVPAPAGRSLVERMDALAAGGRGGGRAPAHDAETGEILDADPVTNGDGMYDDTADDRGGDDGDAPYDDGDYAGDAGQADAPAPQRATPERETRNNDRRERQAPAQDHAGDGGRGVYFEAGRKARAKGMSARAIPGDLRAEDRAADRAEWLSGYNSEPAGR